MSELSRWQKRQLASQQEKTSGLLTRCCFCGVEFERRPDQSTRTFCSRACRVNRDNKREEKVKAVWKKAAEEFQSLSLEQRTRFARDKSLRQNGFVESLSEYERLCAQQDYRCLICSEIKGCETRSLGTFDRTLVVDHDHRTNKFRGLICMTCNQGLGYFKDSSDIIRRAADYLEQRSR